MEENTRKEEDIFGIGFSPDIVEGYPLGKNIQVRGWTETLFLLPIIVGFAAILVRLFWLMGILGDTYRELSDSNRIRKSLIKVSRGVITDRNGRELAVNLPRYYLVEDQKDKKEKKEISRGAALKLIATKKDWQLEEQLQRRYPYAELTSMVLGYMGQANEQEVQKGEYLSGDSVGRIGLEKVYDKLLRGVDGQRLVEVDTQGRILRELGMKDGKAGESLRTNLDIGLQQAAYDAMEGKVGGVVVSDARTGQILALVSRPSFDPGVFEKGGVELTRVLEDVGMPLFNRVIAGVYPPGSTYKIVSATAGLDSGMINEAYRVEDVGVIEIGGQKFSNWYFSQYGGRDGSVDVIRALARSNDIYFYRLGEKLGAKTMGDYSLRFGLGKLTGIDLVGEAEGLVPSPQWKQEAKKDRWYLGDSVIMAIGQGNLLTTPIQVNSMTAIVANNGINCVPRLYGAGDCQDTELGKGVISLVKKGMYAACSEGGTAYPLFDFPTGNVEKVKIACKTGTAEFGDPKDRTHAWLGAFVEKEESEKYGKEPIVITVLLEAGGEGSGAAAPVVRKILTQYFGVEDNYKYQRLPGIGE